MKRITKIFLISAAVLFLLVAGGFWILNRTIIPVKARQMAEEAASKALGRTVTIDRVSLNLWHGFVVEGIIVGEDPTFGHNPFLKIERVSGALLVLPLVKHHEIIIPALHLEGVKLNLVQSPQGRWNIEDLLAPRPSPQKTPSFRLILPKVVLNRSHVAVHVQNGRPLLVTFQDLEAEVHLGLPSKVDGTLTTAVQADTADEQGKPVQVSLKVSYALSNRRLKVDATTAGPFAAVLPVLPRSMRSKVLSLDGSTRLVWQVEGNPKGPLSVNLRGETDGFRIELGPKPLRWEGTIEGEIKAQIPFLPPPKGWNDFQGAVRLKQGKLGPVPYAGELRDITGEILLTPEAIRTDSFTAALASGPVVRISGALTRDEAQTFGLRATSEFLLEQIPALPEKLENFRKTAAPSGRVQVEAVAKGTLKPAFSIEPVVTARFEEVGLTLPNQQKIRKAAGSVRWQPDLLTVTEARGEFMEKPFSLEGSVVNFAQPEVDATLNWNELSAEGQLTVNPGRVEIHEVKGKIGSGQYRAFGEIAWPQANLLAEGKIFVQELPKLWPGIFQAVQKEGAQGEVAFRAVMEGSLKEPEARTADLKLSSPAFQIHGLLLNQASVHLKQQGSQLELVSARAEYAEGSLRLSGKLSMDEKKAWSARAGIEQIQLEQLASDMKWKVKNQNLIGLLSAEWDGRGENGNLSTLAGPGSIRIWGAQILEVPLLGNFANFLQLPTLRKIAFQEAQGTFVISQGKIQTDNLQLKSPQATLTFVGQGGFLQGADSPIRWRILPTLSSELIPEKNSSKLGRAIAQGASYFIGQVEISGTWKNPKRKFVSKPVTQILNEQIFNLQDALKDLF